MKERAQLHPPWQAVEMNNKALKPICQRRAELEKDLPYVKNVLTSGAERARATAQKTMQDVRKAMKLW